MASLTIDALLELWLADLRANDLAPGTVRRYKSAIESFLAWYDKEEQRCLTLEQLSPITLIGYRNFLQRTQQRATSTVNGHISALRTWCAWLTIERYLETNPAKRIKLVGRQEMSSREGLSPTQVNALLRQVQSSRDAVRNYAVVQILLQTGVRLDEGSQLTLADIEFGERSGRVTIRSEPTVKAVATAWPRSPSQARSTPLWRSQKGGTLTTSAMRQMLDIVVHHAAARGLVPASTSAHTLRHTFARDYLAENPGDVVGLASLLGHTSLDTTRIYSQPTLEQLTTRVESLNQNAYSD